MEAVLLFDLHFRRSSVASLAVAFLRPMSLMLVWFILSFCIVQMVCSPILCFSIAKAAAAELWAITVMCFSSTTAPVFELWSSLVLCFTVTQAAAASLWSTFLLCYSISAEVWPVVTSWLARYINTYVNTHASGLLCAAMTTWVFVGIRASRSIDSCAQHEYVLGVVPPVVPLRKPTSGLLYFAARLMDWILSLRMSYALIVLLFCNALFLMAPGRVVLEAHLAPFVESSNKLTVGLVLLCIMDQLVCIFVMLCNSFLHPSSSAQHLGHLISYRALISALRRVRACMLVGKKMVISIATLLSSAAVIIGVLSTNRNVIDFDDAQHFLEFSLEQT